MTIADLVHRSRSYISRLLRRPRANDPSENPWQQKQNEFMLNCLTMSGINLRGVLHIGGHFGEEYPIYRKAGASRMIFFEPMPEYFAELERRLGNQADVVLVNKAIGSKQETREMHVNKGNGESTSFMKPTSLYDGYFEEKTVPFETVTLDSFMAARSDLSQYNLLVTDTQGFDLEVLMGASSTLGAVDYVYTEVSKGHYCGEPQLEEIDVLLAPFGFRRRDISIYGNWKGHDEWGDVFYVKDGSADNF